MIKIAFRLLQNHALSQYDRLDELPYYREILNRHPSKDRVFNKGPRA